MPKTPRFPFVLRLTTPHMRGKAVRLAQYILNGHNRINKDLLKGPVDGEYGVLTATAARQARYWLGYPKSKINGAYDATLHSYLLPIKVKGAKPLPALYRTRRAARLRAAAIAREAQLGRRALAAGKTQRGVTERPAGTNRVRYTAWYGMIGPWCAMFVTWCFVKVGAKFGFKAGERWAYCPYIYEDARDNRHGLRLVSREAAREGDIVLFHFGSGIPAHVGILDHKVDGGVVCIEGNTSSGDGGSQDNGGGVYLRTRPASHVHSYVRYVGRVGVPK